MAKKNNPPKIIIIGAGLAGLTACNELMRHGFEVIILEARHRAGGRIHTDHTLGVPVGRGACWIHGNQNNPVTQLYGCTDIKLGPVHPDKYMIFGEQRCVIPDEEIKDFDKKFHQSLQEAKKLAHQIGNDISLSQALANFINEADFSHNQLALLKRRLMFFEQYIGADCQSLSARYWDQEESWPGDNCFIINSYQSILDSLIKNCHIEFNVVVTNIHEKVNSVEIVSENRILHADAIIITVPLGVLKKQSIIFEPPLPRDKQNAIERLGMGLLNITAIKFPIAFWPLKSQAMFFTQFDDLSITTFFNLHYFINQPILIGYSGGERGRQLEDFSDAELIEKIMWNFKKIFGLKLPLPEAYFHTRWSQDAFSYGAYSYVKVGASGEDYNKLAEPISNRIFFAGEATCSRYPATTHGAYLSGIREAARIKKIFRL